MAARRLLTEREQTKAIEDHRGLVDEIARSAQRAYGLTVDLEDLVGCGNAGLTQAARRFDRARNVKFSTFARQRILGEVLNGADKMGRLPRRAHERLRIAATVNELSEDEVQQLGYRPEREAVLRAIDRVLTNAAAAYVALSAAEDDHEGSPEEVVLRLERNALVRKAIAALPEDVRVVGDAVRIAG